jgi:CRP-like cAMP-binding protein
VLAEDGLVKTAALRAALAPRAFFQAFAVSKTVRLALFALCWGLAACAGMAAADVADVLSGGKDREVDAAASTAATPKTRQLLAAVCETRRFVASVLSFPCALLLSAQVRRGSCAELLLIKEGGHHVHVTKAESVLEILKPWLFCTASQEGLAERFQRHCVNHNSTMEIFQGMSDVSRMACFEHMKLQSYRAGQVIVKKGDLGNVVYFVEKGEALATDGTRVLRLFQAGSFFGEIAFTACARSAFGRDGGVPHKTLRESLFTGGSRLPRQRSVPSLSRYKRVQPEEMLRVCDVVATTSCACWQLDVKHYVEAISNDLSNNHAALKVLFKLSNERLEEARRLGVTLRVSRVQEEEELLHRLVTRHEEA